MIIKGDVIKELKKLDEESVDCMITSPPYFGLRDYGQEGQIGIEKTPEKYVEKMVEVFREIKRVLKKEGTAWLNLGDTYSAQRWSGKGEGQAMNKKKDGHRDINPPKNSGLPDKNLIGIPWRVALALQADGWYLRQDIIWHKPNPMPESVTDRCTKAHEYVFLLTKSQKYYYDNQAVKEPQTESGINRAKYSRSGNKKNIQDGYVNCINPNTDEETRRKEREGNGRNKRSVWTVNTKPFKEAHFAVFPEALIEPMVLAGCPEKGVVLDPFFGAGTTGVVAKKFGRKYIGIELNEEYCKIAEDRLKGVTEPLF